MSGTITISSYKTAQETREDKLTQNTSKVCLLEKQRRQTKIQASFYFL